MKFIDRTTGNRVEQIGKDRYILRGAKFQTMIYTSNPHFLTSEEDLKRYIQPTKEQARAKMENDKLAEQVKKYNEWSAGNPLFKMLSKTHNNTEDSLEDHERFEGRQENFV